MGLLGALRENAERLIGRIMARHNRTSGNDMGLEALAHSPLYLKFQPAFTQGTGLPLALHGPWMPGLVGYFRKQQNRFCALMATANLSCAACYELQQRLTREGRRRTKSLTCFAGLCETVVPVRTDAKLWAFLHTGQVSLDRLSRTRFQRLASQLRTWGCALDLKSLEEAYFETRVISTSQYEALVALIGLFAEKLSAEADELLLQARREEVPAITRARLFIHAHHTEPVPLARVAQAVHASPAYLRRHFKRATGMLVIEYLGRTRVETAKRLLRNPSLRISAIALESGFHSLSQFNRTFRRITGRPPRALRHAPS